MAGCVSLWGADESSALNGDDSSPLHGYDRDGRRTREWRLEAVMWGDGKMPSLLGGEMCLRDSIWGLRGGTGSKPELRTAGMGVCGLRRPLGDQQPDLGLGRCGYGDDGGGACFGGG